MNQQLLQSVFDMI